MQTFLPYPDFQRTAEVLDSKRLWKQCVEVQQILAVLLKRPLADGGKRKGWVRHPAVRMWRGFETALKVYFNHCLIEVVRRREIRVTAYGVFDLSGRKRFPAYPGWLGREDFHASHRSNLLRKDPVHYGRFGWTEPPDLPYVWPV